jgi:hypothetical protein
VPRIVVVLGVGTCIASCIVVGGSELLMVGGSELLVVGGKVCMEGEKVVVCYMVAAVCFVAGADIVELTVAGVGGVPGISLGMVAGIAAGIYT